MKRGDFVTLQFGRQRKKAMVVLASPCERSLMLSFDGALTTDDGGAYFGAMPVLLEDDGMYRDLRGQLVTREPFRRN